jgi:hypothetical protein
MDQRKCTADGLVAKGKAKSDAMVEDRRECTTAVEYIEDHCLNKFDVSLEQMTTAI